jgi:hypothetical protein
MRQTKLRPCIRLPALHVPVHGRILRRGKQCVVEVGWGDVKRRGLVRVFDKEFGNNRVAICGVGKWRIAGRRSQERYAPLPPCM